MEFRVLLLAIIVVLSVETTCGKTYFEKYHHVSTLVDQNTWPLPEDQEKRHGPCLEVTINKTGTRYNLCLSVQNHDHVRMNVVSSAGKRTVKLHNDPRSAIVKGYETGHGGVNSSASGYVHEGHFFGQFRAGEKEFVLEHADLMAGIVEQSGGAPYPLRPEEKTVMYEVGHIHRTNEAKVDNRSDERPLRRVKRLVQPETFGVYGHFVKPKDQYHEFNPIRIFDYKRPYAVGCRIGVVADPEFFREFCFSAIDFAFLRMADVAISVRNIFYPVNWDGINLNCSQNVDYVINDVSLFIPNYMTVFTHDDATGFPAEVLQATDPMRYRDTMSRRLNLNDFCMVIVLTGLKFQEEPGSAYRADPGRMTGGICEENVRMNGEAMSRNLFVVSGRSPGDGAAFGHRELNILAASLMAESMGAGKDDPAKDPDCGKTIAGEYKELGIFSRMEGLYLMGRDEDGKRPNGNKANNYRLSECSRKAIERVLRAQGTCFFPLLRATCGNGIVEPGEECDCGTTHYFYPCKQKACCDTITTTTPCAISPGMLNTEDCKADPEGTKAIQKDYSNMKDYRRKNPYPGQEGNSSQAHAPVLANIIIALLLHAVLIFCTQRSG